MARVTLGDIVIGGLVAAGLMLGLLVAVSLVMFVGLGAPEHTTMDVALIAACVMFMVGGVLLARAALRAGYNLLRPMALGFLLVLLVFYVPIWAGYLARGDMASADPTFGFYSLGLVGLGLFFVVSLAAVLNSRSVGPTSRSLGSAPGQFGMYIYKSNQPAVYEGIRKLEFESDAPATVYKKQQMRRL